MKTNLTVEEREALVGKVRCVPQEDGLWTVYEEDDELPINPYNYFISED